MDRDLRRRLRVRDLTHRRVDRRTLAGVTATSTTVSCERVIAAPAERIFDLLADPDRHHDIDGSGSVRDAKRSPARLALGSTFGMSMRLGVPYSMVSEVVEFEENRRIAWQTWPPVKATRSLFGGRVWRYELEPVEGGTLVRETWDVARERPLTRWMLTKPQAREHTRAAMSATLDKIAQLVAG
jgi:uncharacterized protein YndB with AHSA1/START domain